MKNIAKFLADLADLDVKLWTDGDRLRINAPQDVLTPPLRAELSERKTEILAFLRQADTESTAERIRPINRDGNLPLSFAQQRLWFLDQLEGPSATYNITAAARIDGPLDAGALGQALDEIVRRHETLRTTFAALDGQPVQVIAPTLLTPLAMTDLRTLPQDERSATAARLLAEETQHAFDLATGPLFRAALLHLSETGHVLQITMHHIISDGWSLGVLFRELGALYEAFSAGQPSSLPELPVQYADFAAWQREWLAGGVLERQLEHWKRQLAGAPPLLNLPTDRPHPPVQTFRGSITRFEVPRRLTDQLDDLGHRANASLFMTLLAAFATLLSRYSGQDDVVVGSPIANRSREEIEPLLGFFANTLMLRTDLSGDPTFLELLERVRGATLDAYEHQDVPFEKLVEELEPQRNLSHSPLFQVAFTWENVLADELKLPGLAVTPVEPEYHTSMFDLTLYLEKTEAGLAGTCEYKTDLFDAATIERMISHFQTLLAGIVAHPDQEISRLPLLTESEQRQLLLKWNDAQAEYPRDKCIHQLFEEQVERSPNAIAVTCEGHQPLTYRELNARANQLARHLQSLGVGPDVLVGVCLERSPGMIVGLMGILKAGGAYVPLDPDYPEERLAFMIADSQTPVLLTQKKLAGRFAGASSRQVRLDADWDTISTESEANLPNPVTPDNLAYVIYTSGSTGKPKGSLLEHRNVVRLMVNDKLQFTFTERDVWTLFHSYCFDFSVWEMYGALLYGGRLVIVPQDVTREPRRFLDLLSGEGVTILNQTPTFFYNVIREALAKRPRADLALRYVIFGGEALMPLQLKEWRDAYPEVKLVNMYGITETTVHVTFKEITGQNIRDNVSNIGVPIPTTTTHVLDANLRLQPLGVPGELCVGGLGVGRGYLGRDELSTKKFIPNPYQPAERIYRSGDLVKRLPNGEIEYLGRIDHQVKVRGFRVELGEIESVLVEHPAVRESIVVARQDSVGSKQLTAYVVGASAESQVEHDELRLHLQRCLPNYMIPSAFVTLDALPLTPNGKIDRRALPEPERVIDQATYVAPRNATEETLAAVWAEVLNLEQIGIHDNFFELGGHSLLATLVTSRLREALRIELPVRSLFESPTIADLGAHVAVIRQTLERHPDALGALQDDEEEAEL